MLDFNDLIYKTVPLNVIPENITHNLNSVNQTFHKKHI